jgi:hypothetical protein
MKLLGKGCLMMIGVVVLLGILGALAGSDVPDAATGSTAHPAPAADPGETAGVAEPAEPTAEPVMEPTAEPVYGIGQDVLVGDVRWRLLEATDIGPTLVSDNQYVADATTAGTFVRVRFEVENRTSDQLLFSDVELVGAQGRTFNDTSDFEVLMHLPNEEQCVLEQLNPNVPQTCQMIFELPADAQSLHLQVGDLVPFRGREAQIALGF